MKIESIAVENIKGGIGGKKREREREREREKEVFGVAKRERKRMKLEAVQAIEK